MKRKDPPKVSPSPQSSTKLERNQKKKKEERKQIPTNKRRQIPTNSRKPSRSSNTPFFPEELYNVLEFAASNGCEDIISWTEQGCAFAIHDHARFASELMSVHFSGTRSDDFCNFARRIMDWGFFKICLASIGFDSVGGLSYVHPFFQRDKSEILDKIIHIGKEKDVLSKESKGSNNNKANRKKAPEVVSSTPQTLARKNDVPDGKSGYDSDGSEESLVF